MLTKSLIFIFFIVVVSAYNANEVKKLSFDDTINAIADISQGNFIQIDKQFEITSIEERSILRDDLIKLIHEHQNRTSWFARMTGLITFKNIIMILMVVVGIVFVVCLCKDILIWLAENFGLVLIYIITSEFFLYSMGYGLSFVSFFKPHLITQWPYLNFFEQYFPLFGLILFSVTLFFTLIDLGGEKAVKEYSYFLNCIWVLASLYTQISFMGTLTVIITFFNAGFTVGSFHGHGYQSGFEKEENLYRCLFLSIMFNACLIYAKLSSLPLQYLEVFEMGIEFWGTLAGSVAALIVSSEVYLRSRHESHQSHQSYEQYSKSWFSKILFIKFFVSKMILAVYCLALMFFGNLLYLNSYTSLGGTFLFFCFLDIEYMVLREFKTESLTGISFVILVNLYAFKQLITYYPEYFLFMS